MSVPHPAPTEEPYSPHRRTALLLTGLGTAGAYHAGVLRALHEVGVKLDIVAGRGVGAIGALFAAVDGSGRLWSDNGLWRSAAVRRLYPWRPLLRLVAGALALSVVFLAIPIIAAAAGLVVFPIDFLLKIVGVSAANDLVGWYLDVSSRALSPGALPTWLPRLVLLTLLTAVGIAVGAAWMERDTRAVRGPVWWRLVRAPLLAGPAIDLCWTVVWDLVRGATPLRRPGQADLARRYTELLTENLGQPGFRELLILVHDLDAGRDLLCALVNEERRRNLVRRPSASETEARRAEVLDLAGVGREHLQDAISAALTVPLATEPHLVRFSPDAYWRGESHRLYDRPGSLARLIEELAALDVQQVLIVSAAPASPGPHALSRSRLDGRGRLGEYLQAAEAAAVRDACTAGARLGLNVYLIHPVHNPIGPFDFQGTYDERSDRRRPLDELMSRGYEDGYHQFIEPVVGASGEGVGQGTATWS
jgi:hypothetical protein